MDKIQGIWQLLRFELPFSAGICVIMGQLLALGTFAGLFDIILGFTAVFSVSAAILVHNDYIDVDTDKINAPQRPLACGAVKRSEALLFSLLLFAAGIILSYLLSPATLLLACVLITIGILYNSLFKKSGLPGNLMVSFSVGMTFVFGALSVGRPWSIAAWFFAVIAALIDLGEEIAADAMDMEGDRLADSQSLAIRHGAAFAIRTSVAIFSVVIILSIIPFVLQWFRTIYLIPILIMDGFIAYATWRLSRSRDQQGRRYIRLLYLGATFGSLLFIVIHYYS